MLSRTICSWRKYTTHWRSGCAKWTRPAGCALPASGRLRNRCGGQRRPGAPGVPGMVRCGGTAFNTVLPPRWASRRRCGRHARPPAMRKSRAPGHSSGRCVGDWGGRPRGLRCPLATSPGSPARGVGRPSRVPPLPGKPSGRGALPFPEVCPGPGKRCYNVPRRRERSHTGPQRPPLIGALARGAAPKRARPRDRKRPAGRALWRGRVPQKGLPKGAAAPRSPCRGHHRAVPARVTAFPPGRSGPGSSSRTGWRSRRGSPGRRWRTAAPRGRPRRAPWPR